MKNLVKTGFGFYIGWWLGKIITNTVAKLLSDTEWYNSKVKPKHETPKPSDKKNIIGFHMS